MDIVADRSKDFKGVQIDKQELAQTIEKRSKVISDHVSKKRVKRKKKKITIVPKREAIKRVAEEGVSEVAVELVAPVEKKRVKVVDLDDSVPHDEQASLLEEMRERYSAALARSERLQLEIAELRAKAQPVATDKTEDVHEAGHLVAWFNDLAKKIPTLDRANEDEDDLTPVSPPDNLDAIGSMTYFVEHFEDIAIQYARVNLLPDIQKHVEAYIADLQKEHEAQLRGKDAEYERQTEYLEEREKRHVSVSKMFNVYREIDTEGYLKKAAETDAALQMAKQALSEEARRKDVATRKAEMAKTESKKARQAVSALKKEVEELKSKNIELNNQYASLKGKFARLNAGESSKSVGEMELGSEKDKSEKDKLDEQSRTITELQWRLTGEQDEHSKTKKELSDLKIRHAKMERETTPLVHKVEEYREETKAAKKKLEEVTANLQKKYDESEEISKRARTAAREAREKQVKAEKELKDLEDECSRASIEAMSYKDMIETADRERNEALAKAKKCEEDMAKCIEANKSWQTNASVLKSENEKLHQYNSNWAKASAAWNEEKTKLFSAIKACKSETAEVQKKLDEAIAQSTQPVLQKGKVVSNESFEEQAARIQELEKLNTELTKLNEEYMQGVVDLEEMVKSMSQKSIDSEMGGNSEFNAVLKKLALAHVSTLRNVIGVLVKMGFADNIQLKQVAQSTQAFIKALSACEKGGRAMFSTPYWNETMEVIHKFINEPLPSSAEGQISPFPQAETALDICGAAFIKMTERWKTSADQARIEAQNYTQSIQEQHLMYAKELTAFKLAAHSIDDSNADINKALMDHVQAMEKIKDENDGVRALAEVQHMQAFVAFIKHHLEWDADEDAE